VRFLQLLFAILAVATGTEGSALASDAAAGSTDSAELPPPPAPAPAASPAPAAPAVPPAPPPTASPAPAPAVPPAPALTASPAPPSAATPASPTAAPPAPARYFYFGFDYGTQAMENPLWVLVNRGYDVLQDHVAPRDVFNFRYGPNGANIARNVGNPFPAISDDGWGKFLREEIFPLSYTGDTARWIPNYSLHLIGGGVTYAALDEWFRDHDVPLPKLWAGLTVMAAGFLNETLENNGLVGYNTDCLADLYVFDLGGILLFSFDTPRRFFSRTVVISDWSLQPALTFPRGELHNVGNYFAAKWAIPFYPRLRLFSWFGEATTAGLSFAIDAEYSISAAAGGAAIHLVNQNTHTLENKVSFAPTAAVFLDRKESLLASLQVTDVDDYFIHLNLYPHALFARGPGIGFWFVADKQGRVALGLSMALLLGMGTGWSGL